MSPCQPWRILVVTAAVVERDGEFLVTRRPTGVHLEGVWEFPGGKCDAGESLETCLRREIREELDAEIRVGREVFSVTHHYSDRSVELHFFACTLEGEPKPMLNQEMRWVRREDLRSLEFPPADEQLIALLAAGA
jgi:mutator protein MutT